jgi:hypothetical protein
MANKTTNYGLTKPLPEEFYDINVQNANMDVIDAKMKELEDKVPEVDVTPESIGAATKAEVQSAQTTADNANITANSALNQSASKAPMYDYGTEDLEAGVSALDEGKLYFVYE